MKKKELGITEGEWIVDYGSTRGHVKAVFENINSYTPTVALYNYRSKLRNIETTKEELNNAKLIADAGTTANKCGLLPSELLEQNRELLSALKDLVVYCRGNMTNQLEPLISKANETINQIEQ